MLNVNGKTGTVIKAGGREEDRMKKILFGFVIFLLAAVIMATEYSFEGKKFIYAGYWPDIINPGYSFYFENNMFSIDEPNFNWTEDSFDFIKETVVSPYSLVEKNNFTYLQTLNKEYLVLYADFLCILVDTKTQNTLWGFSDKSAYVNKTKGLDKKRVGIVIPKREFFSSFLQEKIRGKTIRYNRKEIAYLSIMPWVEGKPSYGIGEYWNCDVTSAIDEVVIINGFIDPSRPDLYFANSRVKTMRIRNYEGEWVYHLKDTPHPQIIKLPIKYAGNYYFIIEDVYSGTKYEDTCISAIYFLHRLQ